MNRRLLRTCSAVCVSAGLTAIGPISTASAQRCVITATLIGGLELKFPVDVAPGTPLSQIKLPVKVGVVGLKESCDPSGTTTTTTTTTTASPTTSSPGGVTTSGRQSGPGVRNPFEHQRKHTAPAVRQRSRKPAQADRSRGTRLPATRAAGGVPTPANPTYSYALPGAAPIGVPNFFIDSFRIPPFLLPIYWAAGIAYDVPWQVLAAINEIETDYGRNLSVSSAGAVGWMQFLPATWKQYAVAATGNGIADPYNPVDAIFTAARYLQAAGAATNLPKAIYAYNHAGWYVQSVLLRARLIGGLPSKFIRALDALVVGRFPVAAPAKYADDYADSLKQSGASGAAVEPDPARKAISIYARRNAPVVAVTDGKLVAIGHNARLGTYLELQDGAGDTYTYAELGSVASTYPAPQRAVISASSIDQAIAPPLKPTAAATSGSQSARPRYARSQPSATGGRAGAPAIGEVQPKQRLFAYPARPASFAAGGDFQLHRVPASVTDVLRDGALKPIAVGASVPAGTVLGRIGPGSAARASHLEFMIRPSGPGSPYVDPKPILDGWKLLEASALYRPAGLNPFVSRQPAITQLQSLSLGRLQQRLLADRNVRLSRCARLAIRSGSVDRQVMAVVESLSVSGLDPNVTALVCGASIPRAPASGGVSWRSIAQNVIRPLMGLLGLRSAAGSTLTFSGSRNTLALPDDPGIQISYTPQLGARSWMTGRTTSILKPGQWVQLINRIGEAPKPVVPLAPSRYAIKVASSP